MDKKLALWMAATASYAGMVFYFSLESEFQTYYHGSAEVPHDTEWGDTVEGDVNYGSYCYDLSALIDSKEGDPYITGRGGSAENCKYNDVGLLGIAIAGWANTEEYVDLIVPNALTISHGGHGFTAAYGPGIDFNIEAASLSEAMPLAGNITMEINAARTEIGRQALDTASIESLLIETSDGWMERDGRKYGRIINLARAIEMTTAATSTPPVAEWLPGAVYLPLLLE